MNNKHYISSQDIAENAKLNHEIAKELKKYTPASLENKGSKFSSKLALNRKRMGLNKTVCLLTLFTLLPNFAQAETCTPTPDCKSLGYTETSCPDGGGVKCPWNTSLMYCPQCKQKDPCQSCYAGWILNSDMTCTYDVSTEKTPIGVVISTEVDIKNSAIKCKGTAIALSESENSLKWSAAKSYCNKYTIDGVGGWHFPSKEELLAVYPNQGRIQGALLQFGKTPLRDSFYWTETPYNGSSEFYYEVSPLDGRFSYSSNDYDCTSDGKGHLDYCYWWTRPVLSFEING